MLQIASALPAGIPVCVDGHKPQIVQTRGAPRDTFLAGPVPVQWHVECWLCQQATLPDTSRAVALLRWRDRSPLWLIPVSDLGRERASMAALNAA